MIIIIALFGLIASATSRRSLLAIALILELVLLAVVLVTSNHYLLLDELSAQVLIVLVITIAGADSTCALAMIVHYSRNHANILMDY